MFQNHNNEEYFLNQEEKFLQNGGSPLLSMDGYDDFEAQLESQSGLMDRAK